MKKCMMAAAAVLSFVITSQASASIDTPLPANAFITFNTLQWAWASPCSPASAGYSCDTSDLFAYQGTQGWRLPTALELATGPKGVDFLFAGANVPIGGVDPVSGATFNGTNGAAVGACATPYFSDEFVHCDYQDGEVGYVYPASVDAYAETWAVRDLPFAVPEPASWAMLVAGFGLIGFAARSRAR